MFDFTRPEDPSEIRQLSASVRKFAAENLAGAAAFERSDFERMASLGLCGMSVSEDRGGTPLPFLGIAAACYELARAQLGPAIYLSVHLMVARIIDRKCSTDYHGEILRALACGEKLAAFCLTESGAGSDAAALATKARRQGDEFIINGEKIYITSAPVADVFLVFARTAVEGISAFIVEKDNPGLNVGKSEHKMGCEGAPIATVTFDNCSVSESAMVGKENEGYRTALTGLSGGRVNIAAAACGLAAKSLERCRSHLNERKQFGMALAEMQGLQFIFADMATHTEASLLMTRDAALAIEQERSDRLPASMAKCFATDAAMKVTTDAVQLFGGAGYLQEYGIEQLMRDAKMLQIVEGTNQIQRMIIARETLLS